MLKLIPSNVGKFKINSVTSKKPPNVYKSCPKMISQVKWKVLTPLQKLPKMCWWFGSNNYCPGLWKFAQNIKNCPSGHTDWGYGTAEKRQEMYVRKSSWNWSLLWLRSSVANFSDEGNVEAVWQPWSRKPISDPPYSGRGRGKSWRKFGQFDQAWIRRWNCTWIGQPYFIE